MLLTPATGQRETFGLPWAADNAAFSGFDGASFVRMLDRITGKPGCLWVACPDVVCDAVATLDLFPLWRAELVRRGLPVALVAQNGMERMEMPWSYFDCLFVGGDDGFKDGPAAAWLVRAAKRRHKIVHVGRVNTMRRVEMCVRLGADSFDGTGINRGPDINLPKMLRRIGRAQATDAAPRLW